MRGGGGGGGGQNSPGPSHEGGPGLYSHALDRPSRPRPGLEMNGLFTRLGRNRDNIYYLWS